MCKLRFLKYFHLPMTKNIFRAKNSAVLFMVNLVNSILIFFLLFSNSHALSLEEPGVKKFIQEMVSEHQYDKALLDDTFSKVRVLKSVLKAISRPAEKKLSWHNYRKIFFDGKRPSQGLEFWKKHRETLERAYEKYGVPPEIIVAIIGVETRYGRVTGSYKVIDSLSTLAFRYPKRAKFFRKQLVEFLLLAREQKIDPLSSTGSYAGAMGIPQFIPSSYRHYAVDFDNDGHIDIWNNPNDAIGSVANYFHEHGWEKGKTITVRAMISGEKYKQALNKSLKPSLDKTDLENFQINSDELIGTESPYKLLELEQLEHNEYWLGLQNFYVITRYNHSVLYAMAVFQLSEVIRMEYEKSY